jgi:hypothetical protein
MPNSKNMTTKTLAIILMTLLSFSCSKENVEPVENEKLTKIETYNPSSQNTSTTEFKYDDVGNLIQISSSSGNLSNEKQTFLYNSSGKLLSNTLSNNVSGAIYKYDFQLDVNGRIVKAVGTSFLPSLTIDNHNYTYDPQGRLIIDSVFTKSGSFHSYVNFDYDNNNNVIAYQQFVNNGVSIISQGRMSFQYDNKRSPYFKVGELLYTSLGGSGVSYFYLSRNNPTVATLNNSILTPGGNFIYQYYPNSLLKTSTVNVPNATSFRFYYSH